MHLIRGMDEDGIPGLLYDDVNSDMISPTSRRD